MSIEIETALQEIREQVNRNTETGKKFTIEDVDKWFDAVEVWDTRECWISAAAILILLISELPKE